MQPGYTCSSAGAGPLALYQKQGSVCWNSMQLSTPRCSYWPGSRSQMLPLSQLLPAASCCCRGKVFDFEVLAKNSIWKLVACCSVTGSLAAFFVDFDWSETEQSRLRLEAFEWNQNHPDLRIGRQLQVLCSKMIQEIGMQQYVSQDMLTCVSTLHRWPFCFGSITSTIRRLFRQHRSY